MLGSAAADLLSGLGPAPLTAGQVLAVGPAAGPPAAVDLAPYPVPSGRITLPIRLGPRDGWLTPAGRATLTEVDFSVAQESNRIGLRLRGAPVEQAGRGELPGAGRRELVGAGRGELPGAGRAELPGAGRGELPGAGRSDRPGAGRGELPSEGLVWGAVQLLPDGNLVIFLADHPTIGGYPVIAVVDPGGFSDCAQAAPGATVRFRVSGG
jgi:allophanate hydrolase subunit 2